MAVVSAVPPVGGWTRVYCCVTNGLLLLLAGALAVGSCWESQYVWPMVPIVGNLNFFRAVADMSHLYAMLILLYRVGWKRNAFGISFKTQELYLLVFCSRYLDLGTVFYSVYNATFKVAFILLTLLTRCLIRRAKPYRDDPKAAQQDAFPFWKWIVAPVFVIALICWYSGLTVPRGPRMKRSWSNVHDVRDHLIELFWGFSIILEPFAILPQFAMLHWHSDEFWYAEIETLLGRFVFYLGIYRALYILNWIYRSTHEPFYAHIWLAYVAGAVQSFFYADFAQFYILSKYYGRRVIPSPVRFLRHLAFWNVEPNHTLRARAAARAAAPLYPGNTDVENLLDQQDDELSPDIALNCFRSRKNVSVIPSDSYETAPKKYAILPDDDDDDIHEDAKVSDLV